MKRFPEPASSHDFAMELHHAARIGAAIIFPGAARALRTYLRGGRRAGGHNSLTRTRLKPNLMVGGYAQFTYHFNYWGPTGVNRDTFVLVRRLDRVKW